MKRFKREGWVLRRRERKRLEKFRENTQFG
jgi:hypothetical protein